ncbi:DUF2073 domain-containing protein [Candidatus Woesearchaeota archaeon]|nr:DUF2073 domain-containing protein [Candidatus Woesearchaeota archaeon]MCF7900720.1 DUF2073 domain-containing protein [Candidatus Woesearchaeota archaeon]MCF8013241.1 DUF2073 domain-containing protein [Candidatus Woesearchaeota archaeon]
MLTLQFIPYHEMENLDSKQRISKLLKSVKSNKIVLMEGRLKSSEEAELIRKTMEEISPEFKGIELSVVNTPNTDAKILKKFKSVLVNMLLGDRHGLTIIGPAKIIKEIKQDPDKIQLLTEEIQEKTKSKGKKRSK